VGCAAGVAVHAVQAFSPHTRPADQCAHHAWCFITWTMCCSWVQSCVVCDLCNSSQCLNTLCYINTNLLQKYTQEHERSQPAHNPQPGLDGVTNTAAASMQPQPSNLVMLHCTPLPALLRWLPSCSCLLLHICHQLLHLCITQLGAKRALQLLGGNTAEEQRSGSSSSRVRSGYGRQQQRQWCNSLLEEQGGTGYFASRWQ
jgi:hypothetical protein